MGCNFDYAHAYLLLALHGRVRHGLTFLEGISAYDLTYGHVRLRTHRHRAGPAGFTSRAFASYFDLTDNYAGGSAQYMDVYISHTVGNRYWRLALDAVNARMAHYDSIYGHKVTIIGTVVNDATYGR